MDQRIQIRIRTKMSWIRFRNTAAKLPFFPPYIDEGFLGHVLMDAGHSGPGVGGHVSPMSDPLAAAHAGRQPLLRIKLRWEVHGVSPAAQR